MKYKSLFALAASLLFAVACDKSKEFEPQFSFTGDSVQSGIVSVAAEGTSLSFVAQSNISWNITCDQSWVVVTPAKFTPTTDDVVSTNVSVNVLANEAYDSRNATLTVQAGSTTTVIRINQEAADVPVYLEVKDKNGNPASKVEEDAEGGDVTFTVFANTTWDANTTNEWITLEKSTSSVKLTVAENTETTPRDGEVVISGEGVESVKIAVKQAGKTLVLEVKDSEGNAVSTLNVEAAGKEVTLSVNSNVDWNATTTDTWITLAKDGTYVKVTVAENTETAPRDGEVVISGEGVESVKIAVKQAAGEKVSVSPIGMDFESLFQYSTKYYYWSQSCSFSSRELWKEEGLEFNSLLSNFGSTWVDEQFKLNGYAIPAFWDEEKKVMSIGTYYSFATYTASAEDAANWAGSGVSEGDVLDVFLYAGSADYIDFDLVQFEDKAWGLVEKTNGTLQAVLATSASLISYFPAKVTRTQFQEKTQSPTKVINSVKPLNMKPIAFDKPIKLEKRVRTFER